MRNGKYTTFFINPMGYGTLGKYDSSILSNLCNSNILYICNKLTTTNLGEHNTYKLFDYSDKKGVLKVLAYIKALFGIQGAIKKYNPKSIHFQWLKMPYIDLIQLFWIQNRKIKIIYTAHNILPHGSGSKYRFIYSLIYKLVDMIIVHTERTKEEMALQFKLPENKIHVIPHGLFKSETISRIEVEKLKSAFIAKNNLNNKIVFGTLGRINEYKGIGIIAEAWGALSKEEKNGFHLIIAGQGKSPYIKSLEQEKNVIVINRTISNEEFQALLELFDFVLLPYLKISQSGFLLTAINEKKRVIVSDKGGLSEPFRFGDIGYILDELTGENLKDHMLLASKNVGKFPKEEVWESIFRYYDWETIANKTEKLYL